MLWSHVSARRHDRRVGQCFRACNPSCRVVAVEPSEPCTLMCGEVGRHLIEGISDGFVPGIVARHRSLIDQIVAIDSRAAIAEIRQLAGEHGLFVGPSSGANLLAARQLRADQPGLRVTSKWVVYEKATS